MSANPNVLPFENCPALDGYHCQSSSLAKIYRFYGHPLSEEMLLGLGAGMGYIYWKMKPGDRDEVLIGGRGNHKGFFKDLGNRTGVKIDVFTTKSAKKAETALLEKMKKKEPVMMFGDMGFMPWLNFPIEYHFGAHTFVVCGYDGEHTLLASDIDQRGGGLKKGSYSTITLEQLAKTRGSTYKPFPPKNAWLEFDFSGYRNPAAADIYSSIEQTAGMHLDPPIKNMGVKGIRHTAKEILKWPEMFNDYDLRMNLFSIYIFVEVGGSGGGNFRYMYSRFLKEAAGLVKNNRLLPAAEKLQRSGELFSEIAFLFQEALKVGDISPRIKKASELFLKIGDLEEEAYKNLHS